MDKREIRFDGWRVDFISGEISRDGSTNRLQDQPLQILDELVKQPGAVVTREQLIARLWPAGVVEFDTGINSAIRKLRQALGDDPDSPRYIETLPRKGYRFIGKLEAEAPAPPSRDSTLTIPSLPLLASEYIPTTYETGAVIGRRSTDRRAPVKRLVLGLGSLVAAVILAVIAWHMPGKLFVDNESPETIIPTIVVLPLVDMSAEQNEQAMCDGLTEELSNWLAHIPSLRVVARTSAYAFKGKSTDVRQIASELGATHVLEGSLRRSGPDLRITVQLIEAAQGLHIWSKSFDLPIGDIFQIEDTVSRSVAEAMHLELAPDTARLWAQRQPEKMEAYEYYLLGRDRQRLRTAADNLKSAEFFQHAIAADPQFALAYTALAETLLNGLSLNRTPIEDVSAEVEPLVNRALALAPNLSDALAAKGRLLTEQFKMAEALPLLQRAIKANPNDARGHRALGRLYDHMARPGEALTHFSAAASLDPLDFIAHVYLCMSQVDLGELTEAQRACDRARQLEPNNMWPSLATFWIPYARGDTGKALEWIDGARKFAPNDEWLAREKIELLLTLGQIEQARVALKELPNDGGFFPMVRAANVEWAAGGAAAVKSWLATHDLTLAATGDEFVELARLQLMAGDPVSARATMTQAQRLQPLSTVDVFDGSQIRYGYSVALLLADLEMLGGGDRARGLKLLTDLDAMLDKYQQNGGDHFGLYWLRAESLIRQGKKDAAVAALKTAYAKGWRATWRTRREPFFDGVTLPAGS